MDSDWRHVLLVLSALGEDNVELVHQEQVPMRPELLDLFELDELKKYYTGEELGGHRADSAARLRRREGMTYDAHFRVWRGDSEKGELVDYPVEVNEGEVVLDIIHRLQQTEAQDLAVRWNCKAGKCGSCSMEINGRPRLACMTRMSTFEETEVDHRHAAADVPGDPRPRHRRVLQLHEGPRGAGFAPPPDLEPGEYRMQQVDVERSQEFRKCIECYLCQNTCHVVRDHEENKENFAGPRYLMRIAELDMHPLDVADRKEAAQEEHGLGYCNITKCCTEVCPEHIKITDNALIPLKERVVDRKYDPVVWLGKQDLQARRRLTRTRVSLPRLGGSHRASPSPSRPARPPAPPPSGPPRCSSASSAAPIEVA